MRQNESRLHEELSEDGGRLSEKEGPPTFTNGQTFLSHRQQAPGIKAAELLGRSKKKHQPIFNVVQDCFLGKR